MAKRSLGKKVFSAARGLGRKSTQIARQLGSKAIDIGKNKAANYIVDTVGTAAAAALL
jgi:hypothetical protein